MPMGTTGGLVVEGAEVPWMTLAAAALAHVKISPCELLLLSRLASWVTCVCSELTPDAKEGVPEPAPKM